MVASGIVILINLFLSSGHHWISISAVADPVFLFVDICKWVEGNSAMAEWKFLLWPSVKKQPKTDIFPNFPQIKAFLQQNILCYLFINGPKPIFCCLICVQMSKTYCKQRAHDSMFLEGKFSNSLPVNFPVN